MVTLSRLMKSMSSDFDSKILDFGCGDGREIDSLRRIGFKNLRGFDIARWSTNAIIDDCITYDPDSIGFLERNTSKFDVIFSRDSAYYVPVEQQERLWRAFYGALKPQGKIVVITFNGALSTSSWILQKDLAIKFAFNEKTLQSFPQNAGFANINVEKIRPEHRSIVGAAFFWFVLGYGELNSRLRYFTERGIDSQNPRLFSKQIVMTAQKL